MSIQAVSGVTAVQQTQQVTSTNPPPKQQTQVPEDKVTISSAARAQQTASTSDKDHDGDSK